MDTNNASMARDNAATQTHYERSYPQVDWVGSYLRIWERLVHAENGTEVIAREVHRERPPRDSER